MALSKKDIDTRYAKLPGMRKPLSEPMNRQDANPYITPTTLVTIILRLKLITIAPKQVVIKTITQASIPNPIASLRNREIPPVYDLPEGWIKSTGVWPMQCSGTDEGWSYYWQVDKTVVMEASRWFESARRFINSLWI